MNCLLVDDEPGIREGLAALLRRKGHEVHTAGDCAAAAARLAERTFDLVITDWRLPDGTAATFVVDCPCPVVAVSGHPEEVERHPTIREVLTKPVGPVRLLEVIASTAAPAAAPASPAPATGALPLDVRRLVEAALQLLGRPPAAAIEDDGTFVVLRAPLRDERVLPPLAGLGGDLRVLAPHGAPIAELRLCRDGRPDAGLPVVRPTEPWPEAAEFAVDFDATGITSAEFGACLDRARVRRARGSTVHFLNVPEPLRFWATGHGRAHDMPMQEPVGPRLPAVLADLWS